MFSRLAFRSADGLAMARLALARTTPVQIRVCHHVAKDDELCASSLLKIKEGPERDLVNFPRRVRVLHPGKVRMGFIPDEWFEFFYKKTGVTGPYVFGAGFVAYTLSKEIWVVEHEFVTGLSLIIFVTFLVKKLGPGVAAYLDKSADEADSTLKNYRSSSMKNINDSIEVYKKEQWRVQGQKALIEAKRENIGLQLEAAYRNRRMTVYQDVKKRLDYQLELLNASRRIEQRHMVKWIVDNVMKNLSAQQEKEGLQLCVANLKRLAALPR